MSPTIKWLSTHWFLLCFVFASGGAMAWQEVQRQTLEDVVSKQTTIVEQQNRVNMAIIKMEERSKTQDKDITELKDKIDLLIELELKSRGQL